MKPPAWTRIAGLAALVALLIAGLLAATGSGARLLELAPRCSFRVLTGLPCPACGTTRALVALGEGRLLEAFAHNPAAPILVAATAVAGLRAARGEAPLTPRGLGLVTAALALGWLSALTAG